MNREELAWAAGLFDGEGCFYFKLRRRSDGALDRNAQTRINQTDPEVLERFERAVGGLGRIYGPYPRRRPNQRPMWQYVAYGFQQQQAIIAILWKWLGPVKRGQARAVLTQQRENPPQQKGRPPKPRQFQLQA